MLLEAQILHTRCLYLSGSLEAAQRKAADILRTNPEEYSLHLLICRWAVGEQGMGLLQRGRPGRRAAHIAHASRHAHPALARAPRAASTCTRTSPRWR
jgi:hypothetical protein